MTKLPSDMTQNVRPLKSLAPGAVPPLRVLGLDSALSGCSVAVLHGDAVLAHLVHAGPRGQAEFLMPLVTEAMAVAGLGFGELDLLAATIGPGSFTGLRIGLAAARGLALAAGRPLRGIGTLEALAAAVAPAAWAGRSLLAAIDARRGEIYLQGFGPGLRPLAGPALIPLTAAADLVPAGPLALVGSGAALLAARLPGRDLVSGIGADMPDARVVAFRAQAMGALPAGSPPPAPLYLRAPDAKLPALAAR